MISTTTTIERPTFNHPELEPILPYREYMREHMPLAKEGWIAEDLDCLVRVFGAKFQTDAVGKFMILEFKFGRNWPGHAQLRLYALLDTLLRKADPNRERYYGYYIVQYNSDDFNDAVIRVNGEYVSHPDYQDFLLFQKEIEPYQFPSSMRPKEIS